MSVAIAMKVMGGIVMASDTQQSQGAFKSDVEKADSLTCWRKSRHLPDIYVVAGAGYGHFADFVRDGLYEEFQKEDVTRDNVQQKIEAYLGDFFPRHINRSFDPAGHNVQFLVGCSHNTQLDLYVTSLTAASRIQGPRAIGVGDVVAQGLLDSLHAPAVSMATALICAAYIVWRTKHSVEGCGHYTDLHIILPTMTFSVNRRVPQRWELLFADMDVLNSLTTRAIFDFKAPLGEKQLKYPEAIQTLRDKLDQETQQFFVNVQSVIDAETEGLKGYGETVRALAKEAREET